MNHNNCSDYYDSSYDSSEDNKPTNKKIFRRNIKRPGIIRSSNNQVRQKMLNQEESPQFKNENKIQKKMETPQKTSKTLISQHCNFFILNQNRRSLSLEKKANKTSDSDSDQNYDYEASPRPINPKQYRPKLSVSNSSTVVFYYSPDPPTFDGYLIAKLDDQNINIGFKDSQEDDSNSQPIEIKFKIKNETEKVNDKTEDDEINEIKNEYDDDDDSNDDSEDESKNDDDNESKSDDKKVDPNISNRPPIPGQLICGDESYSEDDTQDDSSLEKIESYDITANYVPQKSESKRNFESEYSSLELMKVSNRIFDAFAKTFMPEKRKMTPIPKKYGDYEKQYLVSPPSPYSPHHLLNPRKKKMLDNAETIPEGDENCVENDEADNNADENEYEFDINEDYDEKALNDQFIKTSKGMNNELKNCEILISKMTEHDLFYTIDDIDKDFIGYTNMTCIRGAEYDEEINLTMVKNSKPKKYLIELIHPKAFSEYRFGNCAYTNDNITPDELHINAWHSLDIRPDKMALGLDKFIKENIVNKNDIYGIYAVLHYILKWIQFYPDDFLLNSNCSKFTCKALNRVMDKRMEVSSRSNFLKALIKAISDGTKPLSSVRMPLSIVHYQADSKYEVFNIYKNIFKLGKKIDFLVMHLSYIDISLIHKIMRSEVVQLNFLKKDKKKMCPNMQNYSERFNIIARFVSYSILNVSHKSKSKVEKTCKNRIEFWISVMKKAREVKNFTLLYEIDAALEHPSIKKLANIWKLVSKSKSDEFKKLHELTIPTFKYIKRNIDILTEKPEESIPYLGTFLDKIVYPCEFYSKKGKLCIPKGSSSDEFVQVDAYNMVYQYYLFKESRSLFLNWGVDIKFVLDPNFLKTCESITYPCDNCRLIELSKSIKSKQ